MIGILGGIVIARWSWSLMKVAGASLLDMSGSSGLADAVRKRLETGADTVCDMHLWRSRPGPPGPRSSHSSPPTRPPPTSQGPSRRACRLGPQPRHRRGQPSRPNPGRARTRRTISWSKKGLGARTPPSTLWAAGNSGRATLEGGEHAKRRVPGPRAMRANAVGVGAVAQVEVAHQHVGRLAQQGRRLLDRLGLDHLQPVRLAAPG